MTTDQRPPLVDVRVVSIEHAVAASLCSRHLADLGADVIKVEHPEGGDFARSYDADQVRIEEAADSAGVGHGPTGSLSGGGVKIASAVGHGVDDRPALRCRHRRTAR